MHKFQHTLTAAGTTAATLNSNPLLLRNTDMALITAEFASAAANGTIKLQASNAAWPARLDDTPASASWTDVAGSSQTVSSGGNYGWQYNGAAAWVRVAYTHSSGTDTVTIRATVKSDGA